VVRAAVPVDQQIAVGRFALIVTLAVVLGVGNGLQIGRGHPAAPTTRIGQVLIAHQTDILGRLVGSEVSDQAPVAECRRVTIDAEDAAART